jgi:hypothetical protein
MFFCFVCMYCALQMSESTTSSTVNVSPKLCHKCDLFYDGDCPTHDLPVRPYVTLDNWLSKASSSTTISGVAPTETKVSNAMLSIQPKKKAQWIGIDVPGTNAHVTITFLGHPDAKKQADIERDFYHLKADIDARICVPSHLGDLQLVFSDQWDTLGKSDDIKAGKGVKVRYVTLNDPAIVKACEEFHIKWYHHEPGEDETRKTRLSMHVSVGKDITLEALTVLDRVSLTVDDTQWHNRC